MLKIIIVGGIGRGEEYKLKEDDNIIGRDGSCDINIKAEGISKKHAKIQVHDDIAFIEDLGSANGTFVNNKLIKRQKLNTGDRIGLPGIVFQLVQVKEKKIVIKKYIESESTQIHHEEDVSVEKYFSGGTPPESLLPKLLWIFKYKMMPLIYGVNQEYEWRVLVGILTTIFAVITISLTIFPVMDESKTVLLNEIANRGAHYADEIGRTNAMQLSQKALERIDTAFLETEEGVVSYELFDLEGRIVRPLTRLNEYTNEPFSVQVRESAIKNKDQKDSVKKLLDNGQIGIGKKISTYNLKTGMQETVGILAIRFAPRTLAIESAKNSRLFLESLMTSFLVALIFFGIIYHLTNRPLEEIKFQIEEALRGKRKSLDSKYLFEEINQVRSSVNTSLQRIRELQKDETDVDPNDIESDDSYINTLIEFMHGSQGPVIILNSLKNLVKLNNDAEDLCGIRQSMSEGQNILDITKERGFAATLIELCDQSANAHGSSQQGNYELQGKGYSIFVNALVGKDSFAKCFYISFVLDR